MPGCVAQQGCRDRREGGRVEGRWGAVPTEGVATGVGVLGCAAWQDYHDRREGGGPCVHPCRAVATGVGSPLLSVHGLMGLSR